MCVLCELSMFNVYICIQLCTSAVLGYFLCAYKKTHPVSSFVEKASVKQDLKCKVCSKFSDVLFALSQTDCPIVEVSGQVDIFVRSLDQDDPLVRQPPW